MIAELAEKKGYGRNATAWAPKKFPIEPEWYDADYFDEPRRKSAYPFAHTWANMRRRYLGFAQMVLTGFPFSDSFLDVGCGRGLLMRAMFELTMRNNMGFDVSGFDFSQHAVNTADHIAKPFVRLAAVGGFKFERKYDVMLMINILEHLTDQQIEFWLRYSRDYINTAMFAIVARDDKNEIKDFGAFNKKPMSQWNAIFNASGWMQDQEAEDMQSLANLTAHVKNPRCDAFYFKPARS